MSPSTPARPAPASGSRRRARTAAPRSPRSTWIWPLLVVVVTAAYTAIPYLTTGWFYQRGDTAAQFAPTWWHFGDMVRDGQWPLWLDPQSWAGGNYVAEALFGTYNPLNVLIWVAVSLGPDLAVSTYLVKAAVMVLLALGTYALAREYDAAPAPAAAVAIALPFSGFTLFWDAGSWPSGLMAFAYAPWVWVTFRRALRGVGSPFWAFLAGLLAVLNGNPYGTLAVVTIGAALVVEGVVLRSWGGVVRLALVGVAVAAFLPLVYLPLLESSDLAVRSAGALFENSGKLRPTAGDLLAASSPLHTPPIRAITGPMMVPATFLAWFVLPLLPWLRYDVVRRRARELVGLGLITGAYLALTLGPSKLWLFRWPLRVIEYFYLGVLVVFAVLLSQGLARSGVRPRAAATALVLAALGWLTWSQDPSALRRAAIGTAAVAALTVVALAVHLVLRRTALVSLVAVGGVGAVLALQVGVFGENASSRVWHVPSDVSALQETFADREGRVMQFADLKPLQNKGQIRRLEGQWDTYLPGSMYHPAGVEAVNNYTGMGFVPFTRTFCMEYDGLTQPCGYRNLWRAGGPGQPPLADLMKLDTLVVQPALAEGVAPGEGWSVATSDDDAVVLTRDEEHPWPGSSLSWTSDGVEVESATTRSDLHETVQVASADQGGQLVFAMLAWPGWTADLNGKPLSVTRSDAGLLVVTLPAGASGTVDLTYRPPGLTLGLLGAGLGTVLGLALALVGWRSWRRRRPDAKPWTADDRGPLEPRDDVTTVSGEAPAQVNDR
ncbi:YfhO family protein [Nocardioides sp. SYSU D00065]|uniref:YfhO family protein n=1 Tax=Nocardioides sp. SYSU D00065 TaxID=2817378 RepID=UPI001B335290|nr:YfhO family protein [Nocardioides sp. SYSU D00065]